MRSAAHLAQEALVPATHPPIKLLSPTHPPTHPLHHTRPAVPLLEPHAAELEGLITQLREALQALGAMVAGTVSLER